jgi:hypothetical protein
MRLYLLDAHNTANHYRHLHHHDSLISEALKALDVVLNFTFLKGRI